jgi:anti-sigma regulatory factor (Ser/Thr protein kinase)
LSDPTSGQVHPDENEGGHSDWLLRRRWGSPNWPVTHMELAVNRNTRLEGDGRSVAGVRTAVRELTAGQGEGLAEAAVLLTDELVTNAVVHGGGWYAVEMHIDDMSMRITVSDHSRERPRVYGTSAVREHGRGVAIVDALAQRWGTCLTEEGKAVWFELEVPQ